MTSPRPEVVLLVDDAPDIHDLVEARLRPSRVVVRHAFDAAGAMAEARATRPDLVLLDLDLAGVDGVEVCRALKERPDLAAVPVIFLSRTSDVATKVRAFEAGAVDYVTKPFEGAELRARVDAALRTKRWQEVVSARGAESVAGRAAAPAGGDAVVADPAMRALYAQAARVAQSQLAVLILGETGAGKDVLARAVHRASPRADKPFLALNCAALSASVLESELFGHEKGAFTGALQARPGLFEAAEGGTVFLDEVGDLPMAFQVKLLRVLEQREVLRVGARSPIRVDVRFLSATNRDLERACAEGTFRQDLWFRLNGFTLTVPPLRERAADIEALARRFCEAAARQMALPAVPALAPATLDALRAYPWPGNVRELRNVVERAVVLTTGDVILPEHLPVYVTSAAERARVAPVPAPDDDFARARADLREAERRRILEALAACGGHQGRAAERLGISRRTLINRLETYGIARPRKGT